MTGKATGFSATEERIHALTHGAGAVLSLAGLGWMLALAVETADPWRITASALYGTTLVALFAASTVYHSLHKSPRREFFRCLDHCAIYLLIAGTYTPFLLVSMRTATGWAMFAAVWIMAALGIAWRLRLGMSRPRRGLAGYLAMGWLIVLAAPQVADAVGADALTWIVAGGACYTVGAVFFAVERIAFNHAIWHLFVLGGGACHFLAVVRHVLPVA